MRSSSQSLKTRSLIGVFLILLLALTACGQTPTNTNPDAVTLKLGSKQDLEARILSTLYYQLLTKAGFNVDRIAPGQNAFVFNGIKSGDIDVYPEFTSTGLDAIKVTPSNNPEEDYNTVKTEFKEQFNIEWLDPSLELNDTYAICATAERAQELGITTISDLQPKLSELTMTLQADADYVIDYLKAAYNISLDSFKDLQRLDYGIGLDALANGQADLAFCYSADVNIIQRDFVVIEDDKSAFPAYNPAPVVRGEILEANPKIAEALNPLAPLLTTQVSLELQEKTLAKEEEGMTRDRALETVTQEFLESNNLL